LPVKNFIVRGRPGSGKSTMVSLVRERARELGLNVAGIVTPEIRVGGRRVGFEVVDISTGRREVFAHVEYSSPLRVSRYAVRVDLFDEVATPALERALEADLAIIDEIGKMELFSEAFKGLVLKIMDSDVPLIGTAPSYSLPFLDKVIRRSDVRVYWVRRGESSSVARMLLREVRALIKR